MGRGGGGNGKLPGKTSYKGALSYMIKAYVGPGCLSLPLAFQHSGLVLGVLILVGLTVVVTLNLRTLILCKRHLEPQGAQTYADIALLTLGIRGKQLVEFQINLVQLGVCAVFFDFVAENLNALLPQSDSPLVSIEACMLYFWPIFMALALLPSVDAIAPYTGLANVLIFVTIGIVMVYAVGTLVSKGIGDGIVAAEPLTSPLFFATAVYSFEGIANLLPVENSLQDRNMMIPLLWLSMSVVGVIYFSVGLLSYIVWPTVSAGSISAELAATEGGLALSICSWCSMFAVMLTFPVQLFPALELLELRLGYTESSVQRKDTGTFTRLDEEGVGETNGVVVQMTTINELHKSTRGSDRPGGSDGGSGSRSRKRHTPATSPTMPSRRGSAVFSSDAAGAYADVEPDDGEGRELIRLRAPTQAPPAPPPTPGYEQGTAVEGGAGGYVVVEGDSVVAEGEGSHCEDGDGSSGGDDDGGDGGGDDGDNFEGSVGSSVGDDGDEGQFVGQGGADDHFAESEAGIGRTLGVNGGGGGGHEGVGFCHDDRAPAIVGAVMGVSTVLDGTAVVAPAATGLGAAQKAMSLKRKFFRCGLVTAILVVSLLIPNLGVLIDLIGAISGSLLAIIIPSTIDLKCHRPAETPLVRNANKVFIALGVVFGVWGTSLAVDRAVAEFSGGGAEGERAS